MQNLRSRWGSISLSSGQFEGLLVATLSSHGPLQGDMHMCYHLAVYGASIRGCIY